MGDNNLEVPKPELGTPSLSINPTTPQPQPPPPVVPSHNGGDDDDDDETEEP